MKHEIETQLHTIAIEGLPEGWRAVAYRSIRYDDYYLFARNEIRRKTKEHSTGAYLIIEKIQTRRIVLEETEESSNGQCQVLIRNDDVHLSVAAKKLYRVVKEE